MWKWTDEKNIKAIILDLDSLDDKAIYKYEKKLENIIFIEVSKEIIQNKKSDCLQKIYYDTVDLLYHILEVTHLTSSQIISISNDSLFLKEMMQNHIGTISIGEFDKDKLKFTPDFTTQHVDKVLNQEYKGYAAEVMAYDSRLQYGKNLLKCFSRVKLNNGEYKELELIFGGRYYPRSRHYIIDDPLSLTILDFKSNYNPIVDRFFDDTIDFLLHKTSIDLLTYVPMKPKDIKDKRFDRFASLKLSKVDKQGLTLKNILTCNKDFSQKQNDTFHRHENVKGTYELNQDVLDKTVVVIDDVYATGSTIHEIAKVLYEHGAKKVIAIFIAVNQMIDNSSLIYKCMKCPKCNADMKLKISKDKKLFFGCQQYPECKISFNYLDCYHTLKLLNEFNMSNVLDLEDNY